MTASAAEIVQPLDVNDDFDPFSGYVECVEQKIDSALSAPPESQWYHGKLDRASAEGKLKESEQIGSYLIRESESKPGSYVLSFMSKAGINHFRITAMCGDFYIGGREFSSLSDLIGYYHGWSDLLKGERLHHCVPPKEPVTLRSRVIAILTYNKMPDTDELSFEKGDVLTVHNDLGDGWLWVSTADNLSGIVNKELVTEYTDCGDPVELQEWFHDNITKEEAAVKLTKAGPGSWLVRPSDSTKGDYSLYFYCDKSIQRFKVSHQGKRYQMGGRSFDSIKDIMDRYKFEQIVEGYTLTEPVCRSRPSLDATDNSVNQIYSCMRQSSGSDFFLNRRDQIRMKGYLEKKSEKTKKWRLMFFILNETEQQLYYFENTKRSKPKGLIDLSYCNIYPVHDSFFGRPNCFQLVVRALNHRSVYYICAETPDLASSWIQAIKPFCLVVAPSTKTTTLLSKQTQPSMTEIYSLQIKLHNLKLSAAANKLSQLYCLLALNDINVGRTQVKPAAEPCWDDEFQLEEIPYDIDCVVVSVHNKNKRGKDSEVSRCVLKLSDCESGVPLDQWHSLASQTSSAAAGRTLQSASAAARSLDNVGALRISCLYLHEVVMPLRDYSSLKELLLEQDLTSVQALISVCCLSGDRISLAQSLIQIFRSESQEAHLLRSVTCKQIEEEEKTTLFRGSTIASTLMDVFMKSAAAGFVRVALGGPISRILESKSSCEISLSHLDSTADLEHNTKNLVATLHDVVSSIYSSIEACPSVLRYVCGCMQQQVSLRFPDDRFLRTRVVTSFIFLRLLCLALLNPKHYGLTSETPGALPARTLKLVANCLIKLASLVEIKDANLDPIKPFFREQQSSMVQFIDNLSGVSRLPEPHSCLEPSRSVSPVELARNLSRVHQLAETHLHELQKLCLSQAGIKKLVAVAEILSQHRRHYLNSTTSTATA